MEQREDLLLQDLGAEPLAGSGFENEQPDDDFNSAAPDTGKEERHS